MAIYRPEMRLVLHVPYYGQTALDDIQTRNDETIQIDVRVNKCTFERNNHLEADTLSVEGEWVDVGVDPRWLKNAVCQFYIGDTYNGKPLVSDSNLRFTGILIRARRTSNADSGFSVSMEFHDYTTLFLNTKPFPTDGVPMFSDSLKKAWERVCDYTGWYDPDKDVVLSSVALLRHNITFIGETGEGGQKISGDTPLTGTVPGRFTKNFARLQPKEGASAWDVWQYTCGILGLTTFIDRDQCIVTESSQFYRNQGAPIAIWGKNITEMDESIQAHIANRGIRLVSFDQESGKSIEAFYPPPGDQRIKVKRAHAKSKHYTPEELQSAQYDTFEYYSVQNLAQLEAVAASAYNEYSRQEIEGSFKTGEMFLPTKQSVSDGESESDLKDILDLRAGQAIVVEIDPFSKERLLVQFDNDQDRIEYLKSVGYSEDISRLIVGNAKSFDSLNSEFHVYKTIVSLDADRYEAQIHYKNQIDIRGYTKDPVKRTTPDVIAPDETETTYQSDGKNQSVVKIATVNKKTKTITLEPVTITRKSNDVIVLDTVEIK